MEENTSSASLSQCGPLYLSATTPTTSTRKLPRAYPALVFFLVPTLILSIIVLALTWVTLYQAGRDSVDGPMLTLCRTVAHDATLRIAKVNSEIYASLEMWMALTLNWDQDKMVISRQMLAVMKAFPVPFMMQAAKPNGTELIAKRLASGDIALGEWFVPGKDSGDFAGKLVYWNVDKDGNRLEQLSATTVNPSTRPWFVDAVANKAPTLSLFTSIADSIKTISISAPVYDARGLLKLVVGFSYTTTEYQASLETMSGILNTSGLLLLLDSANTLIASVTSSPSTFPADLAEVKGFIQTFTLGHEPVKVGSATFGGSYLMKLYVCEEMDLGLCDQGFNWTVIVLIPSQDFYTNLRDSSRYVGAYCAVYGVLLLASICLAYWLTLRRPLNGLGSQIVSVYELLMAQSPVSWSCLAVSRIAEIRKLQHTMLNVLEGLATLHQRIADEAVLEPIGKEIGSPTRDSFVALIQNDFYDRLLCNIGLAEIGAASTEPYQQSSCLHALATNSMILTNFVANWLAEKTLLSGMLEPQNCRFSPRSLVERLACTMQPIVERNDSELVVNVQKTVAPECFGDVAKISQILINLINVAVKYSTTTGLIVLKCNAGDIGWLEFVVQVTGMCFDDAALARLFQPFLDLELPLQDRNDPVGYGLAISKHLVHRMGGRLDIGQHRKNVWCEFRVALPVSGGLPASPKPGLADSASVRCPSIFVVDDVPQRLQATGSILTSLGLRYTTHQGLADISAVNETAESVSGELSIVIIHETSSFHFDEIRSLAERFHVLLVTAVHDIPRDFPNIYSIGKPLTQPKLASAFTDIFHCDVNVIRRGPRLLIVDKDVMHQGSLHAHLHRRGYTDLTFVSSDEDFVQALASEDTVFNGIILEVVTPLEETVAGIERIKKVRNGFYSSILILGVADRCSQANTRRCVDAGMVDVVSKPINFPRFFEILENHLKY